MSKPLDWRQRHVHLDFHTTPLIGDVASEFDARAFAETFRAAHVDSVNVFAKCHHGQCYYPTKTGTAHPALKGRDLLGEQIEALHRLGIRAPIYTPIAWEEDAAAKHPEWRMQRRDGAYAQVGRHAPSSPPNQAPWYFNNFLHADFQDYLEAHFRELVSRYGKDVDGFWIDIVFFPGDACWSDASRAFRAKLGLLGDDRATQAKFESAGQRAFCGRFTKLIRGLAPQASVFYNSTNPLYTDSRYGNRARHALQTHWELESLPSGFWGYQHFPRLARAFGHWGKPWCAMTGRFQKMWGDFGGVKPQAALEFECFRAQALGGANSVGDQLPPRGRLDRGAYDLIGAVYAQCAAAEPFYASSQALPQVGIVAPGAPELDSALTDKALEGAVQMCEELHYETVVLDDAADLRGLDVVILPDWVRPTAALVKKLAAYRAAGGRLLLSGRAAFLDNDRALLPGLPLRRLGTVDKFPTYWRVAPEFVPALARSERVFYSAGEEVVAGAGTKVLARRVLPYFRRTEAAYCSHFQTPPRAQADKHPAIVEGKGFVYFADPVFTDYRQAGNTAARDAVAAALRRLIGEAPYGAGLPTTVLSVPRRRGRDLLLTLLHYIPTRKALEIDMIEERTSFAGDVLRLPAAARTVHVFGSAEKLARDPATGGFILPVTKGRLLLEVPGFFAR
jgi:hypothetical protein